MSCTHTYHPRVARCIWNALCHFQTIDANIFYMYILTQINSHTNHIIHVIQFTINNTKISSHGLITIQAIHFETTQKSHNKSREQWNPRLGTVHGHTSRDFFTRFKDFETKNTAIQVSKNSHPLKWLLAKE